MIILICLESSLFLYMKLAVFASTKGTDLQAILDAIQAGALEGVDLA